MCLRTMRYRCAVENLLIFLALSAEIHVCCTDDGHPVHRGEGQVCEKPTDHQALPGSAHNPCAEAYRKDTRVRQKFTDYLPAVSYVPQCRQTGIFYDRCTAVWFSRVQPVSFPLCRRLPTEHVSGHLQFKVELTSTGPDGKFI